MAISEPRGIAGETGIPGSVTIDRQRRRPLPIMTGRMPVLPTARRRTSALVAPSAKCRGARLCALCQPFHCRQSEAIAAAWAILARPARRNYRKTVALPISGVGALREAPRFRAVHEPPLQAASPNREFCNSCRRPVTARNKMGAQPCAPALRSPRCNADCHVCHLLAGHAGPPLSRVPRGLRQCWWFR